MGDILLMEMPAFRPEYKKWKKYGYKNTKEKDNLKTILEKSSEGYCMYCYSRIRVDGKLYANLEHAIEKSNSEKLIECIPNIGLTCSVCNQIFKKCGEQKRRLSKDAVQEYEQKSKCTSEKRKQCTVACRALRALQIKYSTLPEAQIILQPMGVTGPETGEKLALQYDILKQEFQPAVNFHTYSEKEKEFIDMHIERFRLNDPVYKTRQLYDFIKNVIDNNGILPKYEYNNLIVDQFYRQLKDKSAEEILKICESIFCIIFHKFV